MLNTSLAKAQEFIQVSRRLDEAATALRQLIRLSTGDVGMKDRYGFWLSGDDDLENLRLKCKLGQMRVEYDQVVCGDSLLGRFSFFRIKQDVFGELVAQKFHAIIFDASRRLALNQTADFTLEFASQIDPADYVMHQLFTSVLVAFVDAIPRITD
jgi:hypothetical protein